MIEPLSAPATHKAVPPLDTIRRIRAIFSERDIFTVETFYPPADTGAAYSCSVALGDPPFLGAGFSVNGKGMSPRWALASAYGELMERLSCSALLPEVTGPPDMRDIPVEAFSEQCPDAFLFGMGVKSRRELVSFLRAAFGGFIRCVPFQNRKDSTSVLLPDAMIRDLCGTTGMCAGNTPQEAMLQGLMEIFERYATRKLYQFQVTPPEIPKEYFERTEVLNRLQKLDCRFSVRDCSLGKGFPVIGLVLTLPDGRRTLRLGASASPVTALERCLTEIFQGSRAAADQRFQTPGALDPSDQKQLFTAYAATLATSSGAWPDAVFDGEPSYPFTGFGETEFENDGQALSYFVKFAAKRGGILFARDCSLLGFPAYKLYMPGASEAFLNFTLTRDDYVRWMRLRSHRTIVYSLPTASKEKLEALASAVCEARTALMPIARDPLAWLMNRPMPGVGVPEGILFPYLFATAGRYTLAAEEMLTYLDSPHSHEGPRLYWSALWVFWSALADGSPPDAAADAVSSHYGRTLADRCL
ncbi:MAG: YcaO-like family protein, partial [Bacillota bacterium]